MREILVSKLFQELLGPRNGIREEFDSNAVPSLEFITGILSPVETPAETWIDAQASSPQFPTIVHKRMEGDEQQEQESISMNPSLNPQKPPSTMGLSFLVATVPSPEFKICLTWAKYLKDPVNWRRFPKYVVLSVNESSDPIQYFDSSGQTCKKDSAEISFRFKIRNVENTFFITMFFVNESIIPKDSRDFFSYNIFQPQIRVVCKNNTEIIQMKDSSYDPDTETTELHYRNRKTLARGHMTSVVWRDIDPENIPDDVKKEFPNAVDELGFSWADREIVPTSEVTSFLTPDLRTEYLPMYSIPSPDIEWINNAEKPVLSAKEFSEMWDPQILNDSLQPIIGEYKKWILSLEKTKDGKNDLLVDKIIDECNVVLKRIESGIKFLVNDDDARLAFCFANNAINLQNQWKKEGSDLEYRPFQIAFILMTVESILSKDSEFRSTCDLLWVPTGGGKTEAYLVLVAIDMAYRRLKSIKKGQSGSGVSVFTRYTLRLLTIQQFRRSLSMFSAAEFLRVSHLDSKKIIGWRPEQCPNTENILWGSTPFSVGLWVGNGVTPNKLESLKFSKNGRRICQIGALEQLEQGRIESGCRKDGEPAQVLTCPACENILALPNVGSSSDGVQGLDSGKNHSITWIIKSDTDIPTLESSIATFTSTSSIQISSSKFLELESGYYSLKIELRDPNKKISSLTLNEFWRNIQQHLKLDTDSLQSTSAARPGYFFKTYQSSRGNKPKNYDFEIICTSNLCPLRHNWFAGSPMGGVNGTSVDPMMLTKTTDGIALDDGNMFVDVQKCFKIKDFISDRIPIPGMTVDDQVYKNLPTMVVATVDKFARLPFEPKAGGLFGNVEYCHMLSGYYRLDVNSSGNDEHPSPQGTSTQRTYRRLSDIEIPKSPNFIIQDELHLMDGPLGSMAGLYESCVDFLSTSKHPVKYIASTATIKRGEDQVRSLFSRELQVFPPNGVSIDDRFFIREHEEHALRDQKAGRLYLGVMAPSKGALTPIVRIWSSLAQTAHMNRTNPEIDRFWTLVGYFNAIRELGGGLSVYKQDIPARIQQISQRIPGETPRILDQNTSYELSGRTASDTLPSILDEMNKIYPIEPNSPDALFTTSMFGTGVDVPRLGLMLVNGQPKTTSSYIQSTGRVGRSKGGLVVVFHRSTRPRDLSHYEYFMRFHRQMHRTVESPTVYPFSPGAVSRSLGPLVVGMLRNMKNTQTAWHKKNSARLMNVATSTTNPEFDTIANYLEKRGQTQPDRRRPTLKKIYDYTKTCVDRWTSIAQNMPLLEYSKVDDPDTPVVLGDLSHERNDSVSVFSLAPQSLRDIEGETGFGVKR